MQLTKHHGLGNDFLVALVDQVPSQGPALARAWCHRTTGIGADGLIFGTPHATADREMTLFNADGSLAEISGNGIRCLGQAMARQLSKPDAELTIETAGGTRILQMSAGENSAEASARVDMGAVTEGPAIPDAFTPGGSLIVTRSETAAVGNPHIVLEVADFAPVDVEVDGPRLEEFWMPEGINVHFLQITGPNQVTVQHWERGSGRTAACGSGATASATLAHRWGAVGSEVEVVMPGGSATVQVGPEHSMLVGPAVLIGTVEIDVPNG